MSIASFSATQARPALLAVITLTAALTLSQAAWANTAKYNFSINNASGISSTGTITLSNTGPLGAWTVTGITGKFTDANNGISGAITGLEFAPPPVIVPGPPPTFVPPGVTDAGFSYDNLFWTKANSPAVCIDALIFHGGYFDVYGMAFDVAGGYKVDLWSDGPSMGGYQLNDSLGGVPFFPPNKHGLAYAVNFAATPEPGSFLLLGSGLSGIAAFWRRRKAIVARKDA